MKLQINEIHTVHLLAWIITFSIFMIMMISCSHAESYSVSLEKDEEYRSEHNLSADDDFNIYSINLDLTESQNQAPKSIIFLFSIEGNGSFQIAFGIGTYDESYGYPENFTSGHNVTRFAKVYFIDSKEGTDFVILVKREDNETLSYSVFIELYFYRSPSSEGWMDLYLKYILLSVGGFCSIIWMLAYWRYKNVPGSLKIFRRNKTDAESGIGSEFGFQQKIFKRATKARKNVLPRRSEIKALCPYCKMNMKSMIYQYFKTKLIFQNDQSIPESRKTVKSVRVKAIICESCGKILGFVK